jgi:4-hydroxybenzoate polyprenyltransferase
MRAAVLAWLRLMRAPAVASAGADAVAGLALAGVSWSADGARCVVASLGLYAAGMILNDHADRAEDARLRPTRPIPRGDIGAHAALLVGLALLAGAVAVSPRPWVHAVLAGMVLAYDYGKRLTVAVGLLLMPTLRAGNLFSAPLAVTGTFGGTTALEAAAAAYFVYIAALTMLGVLEDEKRPPRKAVRALITAPPFAALLALSVTPEPAIPIAIGALLAIVFLRRLQDGQSTTEWNAARIRGAMVALILGTMIYTALLTLGAGRPIEAAVIFTVMIVARQLARHLAVT